MHNISEYPPELINREPVVAGRFYAASAQKLKGDLASYFDSAIPFIQAGRLQALIVPHAGYVYSGQVAASAFNQIPSQVHYERVFLIGSSHHTRFNGASVYTMGHYLTPLGKIDVDLELARQLTREDKVFTFHREAHEHEHSLEVQLPFLQYKLKDDFKLVPIVIATDKADTCQKIAESLSPYFNQNNLFVISTDFSHYPEYEDAKIIDNLTAEAISSNSPETFLQQLKENSKKDIPNLHTSICGWTSVLTMLYMTHNIPDVDIHSIQYLNSGDQPYGDRHQVVGYHALTVTLTKKEEDFSLPESEQQQLLDVALTAIKNHVSSKNGLKPEKPGSGTVMNMKAGVFVSVYHKKSLRGCIGRLKSEQPLAITIQEMAIAAAFHDSRFKPIDKKELDNVNIEISVLSPLKKIQDPEEIILGKHGIFMKKGMYTGTFLPKVAKETGWNKEEYLGHCARDKAKIGWNGWKDAKLYTYEAFVFSHKSLQH